MGGNMYGQVTVCVNEINTSNKVIKAALAYAQRYKATVTAVYLKLGVSEILRWQGGSAVGVANKMLSDIDAKEIEAKRAFEVLSQQFDCETIWKTILDSSDPVKEMLCTDLIFMEQPQPDSDNYDDSKLLLNQLLLESKRPIVMIPTQWPGNLFGYRVVLGWNASPEAMRATSDALPILQMCSKLTVVDVLLDRLSRSEGRGAQHLQEYLSNKRIPNQFLVENCDKQSDVARTILRVAEEQSADLVVVGGYGRSRIREIILGGVTDRLIRHAKIPVFFSH
jgi:nucleotide-binding universal stress UspA family protein